MQVTETLSEGLKRGFTVVVPASEIEAKRSAKLKEIGKNIRLPGFRPGKVPANVVKQRYGTSIDAEVLEESVDNATNQLLSERGLRAATTPRVDLISADDKKDLEFKLELELLPDIEMPDFSSISLTRLKTAPANEAVDKTLSDIAERQRDLIDVEEPRGAEKKEVLTVDFVGKIDDVAFPGGTAEDVNLEVAGSGFIPGFTEQVEGMKVGEKRDITVTFPKDYQAKDLAGKTAIFEITAKKLRRPQAAQLNDEFAKKLGFDDLAKLREAVTTEMQREYDSISRMRVKRELLDALSGLAKFPAPETMVTTEFDHIWRRVEADIKNGNQDDDDKGKDEDTLKAEYRSIAERRVRLGLLLSEIGRVNNIRVAPEELSRAMQQEASRYPGQEAQILQYFRKNPQAVESLRGPLLEEKVVDFILDQAKVEEKTVSLEELNAEPDQAAA